jgi:microcystin-dependent protein
MATFWSISRTQARDLNGVAFPAARAFFFNAGTTTPLTVFQDNALTTPHAHPVVADSQGRFPAVFLTTALYRERVTSAANVQLWDIDNIDPAPVVVSGGGGSVDANAILNTGDVKWRYGTGVLAGFVRLAARTIGSASSGATERANADTQTLFEFLWNADANLTVSSGRGASSAADWAANKTITLPDMRLRVPGGLSDMGNSAVSLPSGVPISAGAATELGRVIGAQTTTLTSAQIPAHNHTATVTDPGHAHTVTGVATTDVTGIAGGGGGQAPAVGSGRTTSNVTTGVTVSIANNTGGGGSHNNVQETLLGTWYMRL